MSIKSFNVDEEVYGEFSSFCKEHGISMSKQVEIFMKSIIEEDSKIRKDYLKKLEILRKSKFVEVDSFDKRYNL